MKATADESDQRNFDYFAFLLTQCILVLTVIELKVRLVSKSRYKRFIEMFSFNYLFLSILQYLFYILSQKYHTYMY